MSEHNEYEDAFSESGFWNKLKKYAKTAGSGVVEKALLLYYASQEEKAPKWAKATIAGALGYFIVPLDARTDIDIAGQLRPAAEEVSTDLRARNGLSVVTTEGTYFAIADFTPAVGYADDLGVLVLAIAAVATYINDDVRRKTAAKMTSWFGEDTPPLEAPDSVETKG